MIKITDFEFDKKLGTGSFGKVYKAYTIQNRYKVAIKAVYVTNKTIENNTINEADIHYKLVHKNIVFMYILILLV